ncbi:MAG TPA: TrkA C-terminal domain-containing protein [Acidimicrobiia bacterium]|nr:TrkA C-terminal domain-containing protein [Acidimicrobiia bacterium]
MKEIDKVELPGLGVRYEFTTADGYRVGVVYHRSGWREFFVATPEDPDTSKVTVGLNEDEAHTLVDMLGGSQVVAELGHLQQQIEGLAIDWRPIEPTFWAAGATIGDTRLRTRTGVSVVAILRGDGAFPAPDPQFEILANDVLVLVGTPAGIEEAARILRSG